MFSLSIHHVRPPFLITDKFSSLELPAVLRLIHVQYQASAHSGGYLAVFNLHSFLVDQSNAFML